MFPLKKKNELSVFENQLAIVVTCIFYGKKMWLFQTMLTPVSTFIIIMQIILILRPIISTSKCSSSKTSVNKYHKPKTLKLYKKISRKKTNTQLTLTLTLMLVFCASFFVSLLFNHAPVSDANTLGSISIT